MKKVISIILFLIMSVLLVACDDNPKHIKIANNSMVIQESKFSEETQEVLKIFENDVAFFDYAVDETIKSVSIDIWTYEDGEWINLGGTSGNTEPSKKRIAIRLNQASYDIFEIDETGYTKYTFDNVVDFSKYSMKTYSKMSNPTNIEIDTEITLLSNLGTNQNTLSSGENFRAIDCDAGVAVTITFSDKSID